MLALLTAGCAGQQESEVDTLASGPGSPYALQRSMAESLIRAGQARRALPLVARLIRGAPEQAEPHFLMARVQASLGLTEQALKSAQRAVALEDTLAGAQALCGVLLNRMGRHAQAEPNHRRALELEPNNAGYHNNLGFSLYLRGKLPEAAAALRRALALDPNLARAHNNLGFLEARMGRIGEARRQFGLAGGKAEAQNNLGFALEMRGELEAAREAYTKAVALDSQLKAARQNLDRLAGKSAETAAP